MPRLSHDNTNPGAIDNLEAVLADQQAITAEMANLISTQQNLVEAGNAEGLLSLLGER